MLRSSRMDNSTAGQVEYDLFQEWWFYVLMFFIIYAFAVAVHLFFDYRQWESDRVKLLMEEAATASSRPDAKRQSVKSETVAKKED